MNMVIMVDNFGRTVSCDSCQIKEICKYRAEMEKFVEYIKINMTPDDVTQNDRELPKYYSESVHDVSVCNESVGEDTDAPSTETETIPDTETDNSTNGEGENELPSVEDDIPVEEIPDEDFDSAMNVVPDPIVIPEIPKIATVKIQCQYYSNNLRVENEYFPLNNKNDWRMK